MTDATPNNRRPTALILEEQAHGGQEVLQRLGPDNWQSIVSDFDHAEDHLSRRAFDVVVIVSERSETQVLKFAQHIRNQPTRTRVATILVFSDEVSSEVAKLAGIDRVVEFGAGVRDVVLHIAQAATQRVEKNRLGRKMNFVS